MKAEKLRRLRPIAQQLAVEAAQLRLSAEEAHRLLDEALNSFAPNSNLRKSSDDPGEEP
jgi:ATP/maltotriose-dependent transcriptional regulator MalT